MPFSGLESEEAQGIAMWEMDRGRKQKDMADLQQTRQFNHLSVNTAEKQNDQKIMVDGGYRYIYSMCVCVCVSFRFLPSLRRMCGVKNIFFIVNVYNFIHQDTHASGD